MYCIRDIVNVVVDRQHTTLILSGLSLFSKLNYSSTSSKVTRPNFLGAITSFHTPHEATPVWISLQGFLANTGNHLAAIDSCSQCDNSDTLAHKKSDRNEQVLDMSS